MMQTGPFGRVRHGSYKRITGMLLLQIPADENVGNDASECKTKCEKRRRLIEEDSMKPGKESIVNVQALKARRDELFKQFEDHPWLLSLATEIKIIDDQIAEEVRGKSVSAPAKR